tara:strand:- start:34827 stop:35246 length:420 start_codon:yes stop_codon:yes gene_type:complete
MNNLSGRCECKKVSFEINQEIKYFSYCHCSQCRRCHGSAFASFIEVEKSLFRYNSGMNNIKSYASSENCIRLFCEICGSNIMFLDKDKPEKYYVSAGTLSGNISLPEAHHVFVGSKASWYDIDDGLKQHLEYPRGYKFE